MEQREMETLRNEDYLVWGIWERGGGESSFKWWVQNPLRPMCPYVCWGKMK